MTRTTKYLLLMLLTILLGTYFYITCCSECRVSISEEHSKVSDISRYLDKIEGAALNIVGHSDNTGVSASIMRLGLDRANFAKANVIKSGLSALKSTPLLKA